MSFYTVRRLLTAAAKEFLVFYAATYGERLARKHLPFPKKAPKRRSPSRRRRSPRAARR